MAETKRFLTHVYRNRFHYFNLKNHSLNFGNIDKQHTVYNIPEKVYQKLTGGASFKYLNLTNLPINKSHILKTVPKKK